MAGLCWSGPAGRFENDLVTLDPLALDPGDDPLHRETSHLQSAVEPRSSAHRDNAATSLSSQPTIDRWLAPRWCWLSSPIAPTAVSSL